MAPKLGRRLAGLEARSPARPGPIALDAALLAGLDLDEAAEAQRLWGRGRLVVRGRPARSGWDLGALRCVELDRLEALVRKGFGQPPEAEPDDPDQGRFWRPCAACNGRCTGPAG